jgi:GMP synthase (glutamine-hydrolysing)
MHIGLLLCDHVRPELLAIAGDYPDMFRLMFKQYAPQVKLSVFDVKAGHYPDHIEQCDAYISSGSAASVYDDEIWIKNFEHYLKNLHLAKKKCVGICFGHQMMAQALGTTVKLANSGWGVGIKHYQLVTKKHWMNPVVNSINIVVSHRDQVDSLPANAQLLATTPHCKIAMYQIGDYFLGLQGHPEFSVEYARALMDYRQKIIPQHILQSGRISCSTELNSQIIVDWIIGFMQVSRVRQS